MNKNINVLDIVNYLKQYVIGQDEAIKQVAVAIINKIRRDKIQDIETKNMIQPFNILVIGSSGSGKSYMFQILSKLLNVAFCKVDISNFTKTGYVGESVDNIIKVYLYNAAKKRAVEELFKEYKEKYKDEIAEELAIEYYKQYIQKDKLKDKIKKQSGMMMFFTDENSAPSKKEIENQLQEINNIKQKILKGDKEILEKELTIKYKKYDIPQNIVVPESEKEHFAKTITIKDKIKNLIDVLIKVKLENNNDADFNKRVKEYMENGIVFIDEIDKIAGKDADRIESAGVQKELLTLVEGKEVNTEVGIINTEGILFIAAGAFHVSKPTDLLPELQGRFPIRIVLNKLGKKELKDILHKPKNNLIQKIKTIYSVDNIDLEFTEDAIEFIADYAYKLNKEDVDIGARRLFTLIQLVIEDIDFEILEGKFENNKVIIDKEYAKSKIESKIEKMKKKLEYTEGGKKNEGNKKRIGFVL